MYLSKLERLCQYAFSVGLLLRSVATRTVTLEIHVREPVLVSQVTGVRELAQNTSK